MFWPSLRHAATRDLFLRALIMWALVRMAFAVVSTAGYVMVGAEPVPIPGSAMIILCGALGIIDIRRRGERALWENLGMSTATITPFYCVAAAIGEGLRFAVLG